jgi:hypothetical protein
VPPDTPDCPLWLNFLREATGGDHDLIRFLQQWCGYSLTAESRRRPLAVARVEPATTDGDLNRFETAAQRPVAVPMARNAGIPDEGAKDRSGWLGVNSLLSSCGRSRTAVSTGSNHLAESWGTASPLAWGRRLPGIAADCVVFGPLLRRRTT